MRRLATLALCIVSASLWAQYPGSKIVPSEFEKGFGAITIEDARKWLGYLAGPECEGRGTGQDGYLKAAAYMADRFKEFGLKPIGDNGTYYQNVPFGTVTVKEGVLGMAGQTVGLGNWLQITSAGADTTLNGKLVFLNAKGEAALPTQSFKGKIVIAKLEGVTRDFRRAVQQSGGVVLTVTDLLGESRTITLRGSSPSLQGRIHPEAVALLAKAANVTLAEAGDKEAKVVESATEATLSVKVDAQRKDMPNVVGLLEGSDPVLKNEYVGIGAHLDHLGKRGEVIYYGADDDGSGSTALIAIAKAMQVNAVKPKRSILFMAFTGEEMGLVGSGYLANNPMIPLDKMICELQMDMVGRDSDGVQNGDRNRVDKKEENIDTMRLVGSKRISTELHELILDTNQFVNFKFKYDAEDVYTRSDHYNFAVKGIPIAFLFDGFHPDYHQPTDTIEKINFDKLTNAAKLFYLVALRSANRDAAFKKDVPQGGG